MPSTSFVETRPSTLSHSFNHLMEGWSGAVRRRLVNPNVFLFVILTAQLMVVLDATIVNVALPHIQRGLGFSSTGLSWVLNGYILTFGGLLLLGGLSGDLLGRKRIFIAGLLLFSAASLFGGFASSETWLLASRAIQGVGGAMIAPTALGCGAPACTPSRRSPAHPRSIRRRSPRERSIRRRSVRPRAIRRRP